MPISSHTKELIEHYKAAHLFKKGGEEVSKIHVDEVAHRAAAFYEKVRQVVDWKEEHLMRRSAISRIMKRRFFIKKEEEIAGPLINELIRGGHFKNDSVEELKIELVKKIIHKYIYIIKNAPAEKKNRKLNFYDWIMSIAACEVEEALEPSLKERAIIEYMYTQMKERMNIGKEALERSGITEKDKDTQIYIAAQKALFKLDSPILMYHILKKDYLNWDSLSQEELGEITKKIHEIRNDLNHTLDHPLGPKLYQICEKYDTPYLLLGDVIGENSLEAEKIFETPETVEVMVRNAYNKRLKTLKSRLNRMAFYSTLSILLTNALSVVILEIPLTKLIIGKFNPLSIAVDILGPTALMFLLVATIKLPKKTNIDRVVIETMKIAYEGKTKDNYEVRVPHKRGLVTNIIIGLFYLIALSISIGAVVYVFYLINFPPFSYVINICFVALIAFAGLKIRDRSEELTVEDKKENIFSFLGDILFLPLVSMGKWLSKKWERYNFLSILTNIIIDTPFLMVVEFLENWRSFLRERKEQIH